MTDQRLTDFGPRLKQLREAAGLTQVQLAERAGMHKLGVAKLEQGLREPAWATVLLLADALGLDCRSFTEPPADRPEVKRGRPPKAKPADPAPEAAPAKKGRRKR